MSTNHSGSCLCNQVLFEIVGSFEGFFLCHCTHCRKDTGSAHAANLFSTNAKLIWLAGESHTKTYNLPGTRHTRSFCKECGSGLPYLRAEGNFLVTPAGSLDTDVHIPPTAHIFYSSKANWEHDLDKVKKFEKFPG